MTFVAALLPITAAEAAEISAVVATWEVDPASGSVDYDVTVSGSCGAPTCTWRVYGHYVDGSVQLVQTTVGYGTVYGSATSPAGFTKHLVGTLSGGASAREITDLQATLKPSTGSLIKTELIHVSDAYPAPFVTIDVDKWQVDTATGVVEYDVTMDAGGLGQQFGPCGGVRCRWGLVAYYKDGVVERSQHVLYGSSNSGGTKWTVNHRATATGFAALEITHLRGYVSPYSCADPCAYETVESWAPVSPPYPNAWVTLTVGKWQRDESTGLVDYDVTMNAGGLGQHQGPCGGVRCRWGIVAYYKDGSTERSQHVLFATSNSGGTKWTATQRVTASAFPANDVTHLRAYVEPYSCADPCSYQSADTGLRFVGDVTIGGRDLVPYSVAMGGTFAIKGTSFCEPLLFGPYPNTNGNSLPDVFESCEAMILSGATLIAVLAELATQAPDTVDDLLEYWERNPAPSEEDEQKPLPLGPSTGEPDPECVQEIWGQNDPDTVEHIEKKHLWNAGGGGSQFYPWVSWRWLVDYAQATSWATPSGEKCQRIARYEPTQVGTIRFHRLIDSPLAGEPTRWYTVWTEPNGKLITAYPGTLDD
ncbi:MAG TPA: hypothetical protein VEU29_02450 [Actinomycetota bacterium]|nr:hypothetical protein [Actinomycetota bacterium]